MLLQQDRETEANQLLRDTIRKCENDEATSETERLALIEMVGSMFRRRLNAGQAQVYFESVYEQRSKKLGPFHPDTVSAVEKLVWTYTTLRQWEKGESCFALDCVRLRYSIGEGSRHVTKRSRFFSPSQGQTNHSNSRSGSGAALDIVTGAARVFSNGIRIKAERFCES